MKDLKSMIGANAEQLAEARVDNFCVNFKESAQDFIRDIRRKIRERNCKMEDLLDLGPENSQDLASNLKAKDAKSIVNQIFNLNIEIADLKMQLNEALKLYKTLFPDDKEFVKE